MINDKQIQDIQNVLQYKFKNIDILRSSLTHPSTFTKNKQHKEKYIYEFERLEFLGDTVLGLIIAFLIFNKFKDYNEGDLSRKFSYLVQREFLYKIALEINLEICLIEVPKLTPNSRTKPDLADAFVAILNAS